MSILKQDVISGFRPVLDAGAALPASGDFSPKDIKAALSRMELPAKNGSPLLERIEPVAGGENAVAALALSQEQPEFTRAVLGHFAPYAALGAALASKAGGCGELVVYAESEGAARPLTKALAEKAPELKVVLKTGAATPVLREESALMAALDGRAVRSELLTAPVTKSGFEGRPTLILELEDMVWLAACAANSEAKPGKLMLLENGEEKALLELPLGTGLRELIESLQLSGTKPFLFGGLTGFFAGGEALAKKRVSYLNGYDSLKVLPDAACMAQTGRELTAKGCEYSCGKCVPCREGSWQFMAVYNDITQGRGKRGDLDLVLDIGGLIREGAFCDYGRRMVDIPMTLADLSRSEIESHITRKQCPAGVCAAFMDYVIDPQLCTGCEECLDACREDAIEGKAGFIHMIDPVMCTKCGDCERVCPENAVIIATGRMRLPKKLTKAGRFR